MMTARGQEPIYLSLAGTSVHRICHSQNMRGGEHLCSHVAGLVTRNGRIRTAADFAVIILDRAVLYHIYTQNMNHASLVLRWSL